jgi:queuosine precursor transporter
LPIGYRGGVLPSEQYRYPELPALPAAILHERRERVFLVFAGLFLGTLAMLNIIGITRFIDLSFTVPGLGWTVPMPVAVGVLPYPITFLCTDFISELYGRRRANWVVLVGLVLNLWVVAILWLGGVLPGSDSELYEGIRTAAFGAVGASMFAYLVAQLVDVQVFHFWKNLTGGRHLWLRNNGSTLVSQLVDTTAVILVTHYYAGLLPIDEGRSLGWQLAAYIGAGYAFKVVVALLDTIPFYLGTHWLGRYLRLPPAGPPHPPATAAVEAGVG